MKAISPLRRRPARLGTVLAALPLIVGLAGCAENMAEQKGVRVSTEMPRNKVERLLWPHSVAFAGGQKDLDAGQLAALAEAVRTAGGAETLHVRIAAPPAEGRSAAAVAAQRAALDKALRRLGVAPDRIASGGEPSALKGTFALSLERYTVTVPSCPDWSQPLGRVDARQVGSNWGCATAANLGMMAADPRDLAIGRDLAPHDAVHAVNGIDRYHGDKVYPPAKGGTGAIQGDGQ